MYRIAFCASKAHFRLSLILPGPGIDDLGGSWGIIQDWSVLHKLLTSGLCSGGELLWGVLQNQHKADSLLSAALLEFGVSSWCVLPAGGSLGAAFPTPKTHQAGAGLHSSEIFSQRGVDGLELLWFQHCLGWCFRRQRGGNELLLGQTPLLSLCDSQKGSLCRTAALGRRSNAQRSPLSLCSRKMCRQFDKAECRLNSLHAAGLSQHQILSVLGKEQRAGLLPGWHCRHCSALDLQVLQTLGQETLHENKNRKKWLIRILGLVWIVLFWEVFFE